MSAHTKTLWKDIEGFPGYAVTDDGLVWANTKWRGEQGYRLLSRVPNGKGYLKVRLVSPNGKRVNRAIHTLVAKAFLEPKPSAAHEVRHKDGERTHNRVSNLCWGTRKDNAADREQHGRTSRGPAHSAAIKLGFSRRAS